MDDERKLKKLEKLLEVADEDTVSNDDFVAAFEVVVSLVEGAKQWTEEQIDGFRDDFAELAKVNDRQWEQIKKKALALKNGKDGLDGRDGVDGKDGKDGLNGKDGEKGKDGKDGVDGSPDTPDQILEKIHKSDKKISGDKIEGLADIKRIAQANAVGGGIGVTKTELATKITGIGTHNLTVSTDAPANPKAYDIWIDIS